MGILVFVIGVSFDTQSGADCYELHRAITSNLVTPSLAAIPELQ
jgi:hypothetical protein